MIRLLIISILLFGLIGCITTKEITSEVKSPSKKQITVTTDDLSNKGLICGYNFKIGKDSTFGIWFKDNKVFEKWFNDNLFYRTDGFEFVQIERKVYTHYNVSDTLIFLNYSKNKEVLPHQIETIDRLNLNFLFENKVIGKCIVLLSKEEFLKKLKDITDSYRKDYEELKRKNEKLKRKRKI